MESTPTLPINMEEIIITLEKSFSSGVIPVDNPTVANADNSSNASLIKSTFGAEILNRKMEMLITAKANRMIE
jgi:hypothetical protein